MTTTTANITTPLVQHSIDRNAIRFYSTKIFSLSEEMKPYFNRYQLVYWSASYFITRTADTEGRIYNAHDKKWYYISYANPHIRARIISAMQSGDGMMQVALSFRSPNDEWKLAPICMVSFPKEKGNV